MTDRLLPMPVTLPAAARSFRATERDNSHCARGWRVLLCDTGSAGRVAGLGTLPQVTDLERIVRDYNAACSSGTVEQIIAFVADEAVIYDLNHPPVVGREAIGRFWDRIRTKWGGATWDVGLVIVDADQGVVAAEWTMHGTGADGAPFAFHGVDLYAFAGPLITEIRQYWRFDADRLASGLVGYDYGARL